MPVGEVEPHHVVQRMVRAPGQPAPGQGDVHLLDRPAGPVDVGRPAQEGVEPLLLVGVQQVHDERQREHHRDEDRHEHPEGDPAEHQHGEDDRAQDQGGGEVRLHQDEADGQGGDGQGGRQPSRPRPVAAEHLGQHQEQAELGELGRLHGEGAEGDPPLGPPDRHAPHVDRHQEHDAQEVAAPPQPAQALRAPPPQDGEQHHAPDDDDELVPDRRPVAERGEVGQSESDQDGDRTDGEGIEEGGDRELCRPAGPRAGPAPAQQPSFDAEHGPASSAATSRRPAPVVTGPGPARWSGPPARERPSRDGDGRAGVDAGPAGLGGHGDRPGPGGRAPARPRRPHPPHHGLGGRGGAEADRHRDGAGRPRRAAAGPLQLDTGDRAGLAAGEGRDVGPGTDRGASQAPPRSRTERPGGAAGLSRPSAPPSPASGLRSRT